MLEVYLTWENSTSSPETSGTAGAQLNVILWEEKGQYSAIWTSISHECFWFFLTDFTTSSASGMKYTWWRTLQKSCLVSGCFFFFSVSFFGGGGGALDCTTGHKNFAELHCATLRIAQPLESMIFTLKDQHWQLHFRLCKFKSQDIGKWGLSCGVGLIAVLAASQVLVPRCQDSGKPICLFYKLEDEEATTTILMLLAVSALMAALVMTASLLKFNPPIF